MPPGCVLGAMLDDIDLSQCSPYDRIRILRAQQRMASHYVAQTYRAMTSVVDATEEDADEARFAEEAAAAEVRAALRLTRRAAEYEMGFALDIRRLLPLIWEALCAGHIDVRRAKAIVDGTLHLSLAGARNVVDAIMADTGFLTTGQLNAKLRKLSIEVDPDDAQHRFERSSADRRVVAEPSTDGTVDLFALNLPPDRVAAGMARVNRIAQSLRGDGETRTMDQLRADVFVDILEGTGAATGAGRGAVEIRVGLATLSELTNDAGDLAGYGSVVADIARQVAEHQQEATWRYVVTDTDTGQPVDTGTVRRRPTAIQRRQVQGRSSTCVFPGCRMPASSCDLDHTTPWAESHQTETDNLAPLCRHDHNNNRHRFGWTYKHLPNGDYLWTSPLGHQYTTSGRSP